MLALTGISVKNFFAARRRNLREHKLKNKPRAICGLQSLDIKYTYDRMKLNKERNSI